MGAGRIFGRSVVKAVVVAALILVGCGGGKAGAGDYKLKISVNPANGGSISISPNKDTYNEWENVEVEAEAANGYVFTGWSGDDTSKSESVTIKMSGNKNKKLTANFLTEKEFEAKRVAEKAKELAKLREKFKSYKYTGRTVKIGNQTWTAENINNEGGGYCYKYDPANCAKYGRMYTWDEAMVVCPSGWHLPNDAEWTTLVNYAGGKEKAGKKLKSKTGWNNNGNGTDEYGFSALPGGYPNADTGLLTTVGYYGTWWSATEVNGGRAHEWGMDLNYERVGMGEDFKNYPRSVRCVQD